MCCISKQSDHAKVLNNRIIIVWNKIRITMAYPGGVEAVKRTLQDIRGNNNLMVRVTVVLAGNLSQTLLVPRGTRADE
jgi:translation initiation factor 2 alpha subunit (eIF-2alpha)